MEKSPETPRTIKLTVSAELAKKFKIKAKGAVIRGVDVKKNRSGALDREIKAALTRLNVFSALRPLVIQGYRNLYRLHDEPEDTKPAAEALLDIIREKRRLPNINNVVDLYNLVAAETGMAIGAHDLEKINGNVKIRKTDGKERYMPIGQTEPLPVHAGKYAAVDDSSEVICYMETRQSEVTKVTPGTGKDIFIYVQGNEVTKDEELSDALKKACEMIVRHCGGDYILL